MIDPTTDNYGNAEFKDKTDFLGSSDSSLEQGVVAVGAGVALWLFFRAFFLPFVLVALLYLFVRMFIGKTDPRALLARVMLLPGQIDRWRQRLHVKVVVKMLPEDVTDAADLRGRLFHTPPQNLDHEHYRETFSVLALTDRTAEQDLQLSQYLRGLKAYGEDPLRMMASQLKRRMAPPTAPQPQSLTGVNSFAMPIPGLSSLSMYLAAACVVLVSLNMWAWSAKSESDAKRKQAENAARTWKLATEQTLDNASKQASLRQIEQQQALRQLQETQALAARERTRATRLAAREKARHAETLDGGAVDLDGRLRDLAEPAGATSGPAPTPGTGNDSPTG